jgi:hypothetical protein
MNITRTLATAALLAGAALPLLANAAETTGASDKYAICAKNQESNAALVARAKNETDANVRRAMLDEAIKANPDNAVCLIDMFLQLANAQANAGNIQPAAGDDTPAGDETPADETPGNTENPNQLNEPSVSPNTPSL